MLDFFKNRIINLLWNTGNYDITERDGLCYKKFIIRKNDDEELSHISVWFDINGNFASVKGKIIKDDFIGNRVYKSKVNNLNRTLSQLGLKES